MTNVTTSGKTEANTKPSIELSRIKGDDMTTHDDKYKPHIHKGGGLPRDYKFMACPRCSKKGVSSRVISNKGAGLVRKVCKYCGWIESGLTTNNWIKRHENQEVRRMKQGTNVKPVPEKAKRGDFGCNNCLWCSIECQKGSMYKPKEHSEECAAYTYYD